MRIKIFTLMILSFIGLCLLSCSEADENDEVYGGIVWFAIEIDTSSILQDPNTYTLRLRTAEIYSSVPKQIVNDMEISDNQFLIHILGIDSPESAFDALGPATAEIDLLLHSGVEYGLQFKNHLATDHYSFQLMDGEIEYSEAVSNFTVCKQNADVDWF